MLSFFFSGDSSKAERKCDCPFCVLEKWIFESLSADPTVDAAVQIERWLRVFSEKFRVGRQEDAHEFLRYVIDACNNACLRLQPSSQATSVVRDIFGGALLSQIKCLSCGHESNKVDEIMDISLDVLHSDSLKDALRRFFQPEVLDGTNKYGCRRYCTHICF